MCFAVASAMASRNVCEDRLSEKIYGPGVTKGIS